MNLFLSCHLPGPFRLRSSREAGRRRDAFALVVTLLILSLLIIIAVSFLSSMSAEHQTADAYAASGNAEQAARAGVDSATSILAESFRDFPDSVTVWDKQQTTNTGTPTNPAIVSSTNNEGTSLYLRAVPMTSNKSSNTVANPLPDGMPAPGGTPVPANSKTGNNPNDSACQTFVLPLVSGVPYGEARLAGAKAKIWPNTDANPSSSLNYMNLGEADPAKQNWTDLNVRRVSGDVQGVIGSPPGWTGAGPKPARAYWVNLTGSNGLVTGRYAFWIDDESFRLNSSVAGPAAAVQTANPAATPPLAPPDNQTQPLDSGGKPRSLAPSDLMLLGTLSALNTSGSQNDGNASADTNAVMLTRASFPGKFFPDPLAFAHSPSLTTSATDTLRYLTTNQSGALNLSRHGSQRLNLNTTIATTTTKSIIQTQVNQLVETLEFHLPYFGERFYRKDNNASSLNDATQVPGSPYAGSYSSATDSSYSQIYHYKVAANLRDYIDTDNQPTMIGQGGLVMDPPSNATLGDSTDTPAQANEIWAQGKESTPYIQEVAVRYRPMVTTTANATATNPKGHYKLNVDYYIEFWNMSDRDVSASQMNGATVWIRDQQPWCGFSTYLLQPDTYPPNGEALSNNITPNDTQLSLTPVTSAGVTAPITDAAGTAYPNGVIFRAGTVTIVTSDPNAASYTYTELKPDGTATIPPGTTQKINHPSTGLPSPSNVFICPVISGSRTYSGKITKTDGTIANNDGMELGGDFRYTSPYTGTEVSLVNSLGYFDVVRGAITKTGAIGYNVYCQNDTHAANQGYYNDFSYGSSLMGNTSDSNGGPAATGSSVQPAPSSSQMGDPRTNNEQLWVNVANTTADGTRFVAASRTLGSTDYLQVAPDTATTGIGWPDYYKFPGTAGTNPDATTAPAVVSGTSLSDGPLTSVGQLGDVFDPARVPGADIRYSHGGGRTFKIGQHDDLYSDDPTSNVYPSGTAAGTGADNISASTGWAAWRLTDIFDVADPIQLPGRININGITRDNGAALLSALQGFSFQPKTTSDPTIHGDPTLNPSAGVQTSLNTTGSTTGFSQIISQMRQRLDPAVATKIKPLFERGELSELGYSSSNASSMPLFGTNSSSTNNALVSGVDMNKLTDHAREEIFRRLAEMICTRGNTFTAYVAGQSILQTTAGGALKITGTQRMRVTFRLVPKTKDPRTGTYMDFHPAYVVNADGSLSQNTFDPTIPTIPSPNLSQPASIGVIPRFAKPEHYDVQILQVMSY